MASGWIADPASEADLVVLGGTVLTMDPAGRRAPGERARGAGRSDRRDR